MITYKESHPRDCEKVEADLVLYSYGKCSEAERRRIDAHLQDCASCRIFLEDLMALSRQGKRDQPPPDFWDGFTVEMKRRIRNLEAEASRPRNFSWLPGWSVSALGVAMVLILVLSLFFTRGMWRSEGPGPEERVILEVAPLVQDFEFFQAMHYLEAMDLDESSLGRRPTRSV